MNKLFPLEKVWKNQCASVPNDKWSTQLSRQNGERTDAEHKLFSRINVGHRHYSSSGLKGQDSLMVLICGDGLSFLDVIAARWRTGRGDSATLHTDSSSGRSWYLHYQANRFRALLRVRLNEKNPHSTDSWHSWSWKHRAKTEAESGVIHLSKRGKPWKKDEDFYQV